MKISPEDVYRLAPYAETLGVQFAEISPERVVATLLYSTDISTVGGGIHGGALMALGDVAAAVLATAATEGGLPATTESTTYFLEPLKGNATATAVPIRVGRNAVVAEIEIRDDAGALAVKITQIVATRKSSA